MWASRMRRTRSSCPRSTPSRRPSRVTRWSASSSTAARRRTSGSRSDPVVCAPGFSPCRTCREGRPYACERFDEAGVTGCHAPGQGFSDAVGGGWGESLVARKPVHPDRFGTVGSGRAGRTRVDRAPRGTAVERTGDRVVVIGPGTIGLLVTASLRMLHPDLDIAMVSPGQFGADRAREAGASRILPTGAAAIEALAASDGGQVVRPRMTKLPILEQGVDAVFDCVGSPDTIDLSVAPAATGRDARAGRRGRQADRGLEPGVEPGTHCAGHHQLRSGTCIGRTPHDGAGRRMAGRSCLPRRRPGHPSVRPRRVDVGHGHRVGGTQSTGGEGHAAAEPGHCPLV